MLLIPSILRKSQIHGIGVFCGLTIAKGDIVWKFDERVDFRRDEFPDWISRFTCRDRHGPLLDGDNARFMNHSDTPNLATLGNDLIAAREILAGEELTCDYRNPNSFCKLPTISEMGERVPSILDDLEEFKALQTALATEQARTKELTSKCDKYKESLEFAIKEIGDAKQQVTALTKERDALRLAFAEASHNAGPAFVAHEELNRLKSEVAALTAECAERRTAAIASAERIASLGNERDEAKSLFEFAVKDACDDESRIKAICAKHGIDTEGDSYGVPGIITCVEELEAKLTTKLRESEQRNIDLAIEADLKYRDSEAALSILTQERDRWSEDSMRQAATINRLAAAEDRNQVDAERDKLYSQSLRDSEAGAAALREALINYQKDAGPNWKDATLCLQRIREADKALSTPAGASLLARLAELEADRERLETLQREIGTGAIGFLVEIANRMNVNGGDIREAIDSRKTK